MGGLLRIGGGDMKPIDIIPFTLIILYVGIILLAVFCSYPTAAPMVPTNGTLVVEFLDVRTKVYRVRDGGTVCYVAVGRLHGYTVSIDCVKDYTEVRHE